MTLQDSISILIALFCAVWVLQKWLRPFFMPSASGGDRSQTSDLLQIDPPEYR